jgi:1,4-alpha-glucan branching enzyme
MQIAFLIIAHVPYVRRAGRQPIGEDELHIQIVRTLIPLAGLLSDLQATGLSPRVALALSPLLTEQLADPVVQKHFVLWMGEVIQRREEDMRRFEKAEDHHGAYLARFYLEWNRQALRSFEERHDRNVLLKFRELATGRVIEPLAGAASYAYLPLLEAEATVRAQIEHGVLHTNRRMGRPDGFWLPGCGWRPGLETVMAEVGLRYVIVDPSSLAEGASYQPAWVLPHRLAAFFIDDSVARHVWSPELGYPGDPLYRDPAAAGGYTAIGTHPGQPYDPYHALRRAQEHANHFVNVLVEESARRPADDLMVIPLDASLIGARWFEGPTWFQAVLTRCATHPGLELTTPAEYLRTRRPQHTVTLREGSWAAEGHAAWDGPGAAEYWQAIRAAERRIVALAARIPSADNEHERALNQAARELILAQTSDWPAQLSAAAPGAHAARWRTYLTRFAQLAEIAEHGVLSAGDRFLLEQLEELDGPFPNLNYRIFAP